MSHLDDFKRGRQEEVRQEAAAFYRAYNHFARLYHRMIAEIDRRGNDGRKFRNTKRVVLTIGGAEYLGWLLHEEPSDYRYQLYYLPDAKRLVQVYGNRIWYPVIRELSPDEGMTAKRMHEEKIMGAEPLRDLCHDMGIKLYNDFEIPNDPDRGDWVVSTRGSMPRLK